MSDPPDPGSPPVCGAAAGCLAVAEGDAEGVPVLVPVGAVVGLGLGVAEGVGDGDGDGEGVGVITPAYAGPKLFRAVAVIATAISTRTPAVSVFTKSSSFRE